MPVTKKKGTIFAIYSDSPLQPTPSSSSSTHTHIHAPSPSRSRMLPARKALSSIQPKSLKPKGFPSAPLSAKHDLQPTPIEKENSISTNPKQSSLSLKGKSSLPPIHTGPSKRQLDVFSSPANSPTPQTHNHITQPKSAATTSLLSSSTPSKKLKITPPKPSTSTNEKENVPPPNDDGSPASRTRSKSRITTTTTAATISVLASPSLGSRTRREVEGLLGDGRGTLTLKKGRAVAGLLKHGKGSVRVLPDEVLGDVSDIYGAIGEEPEGFRTGSVRRK